MKLLESGKRLSESVLWELQRAFYCKQGPQAWSQSIVPYYATSNPYTVRQYAQLTLGFLRDCLSGNSSSPVDLSKPFHIFDLGAGSGQCAYLFLKELLSMMKVAAMEKVRLRYVMTDISENILLFLLRHPLLKPYFQAGILDVAYYEHNFDQEPIHLFLSKVPIDQDLANPIVLICNYFFDTLPQDLFRVHQGQLEEGRVNVLLDEKASKMTMGPDLIPYLKLEPQYNPLKDCKDYYKISEWNEILANYCPQLEDQFFLFPVGGMQAMRYFSWLSRERMFVIVGDHGPCTLEQLRQQGKTWMTQHGNFSLTVNFEAIARYFSRRNGTALLPSSPDPFFTIGAFLTGNRYPETIFAYQEYVDSFQMRDYWKLIESAREKWQDPVLEQIVLLIKFGNWDPLVFQLFLDQIRHLIPKETENLTQVIHRIWDHFYPLGQEQGSFANTLGELLFAMGRYHEAISYFQHSLDITGFYAQTYLNLGASYLALNDRESAWSCYQIAKRGTENG